MNGGCVSFKRVTQLHTPTLPYAVHIKSETMLSNKLKFENSKLISKIYPIQTLR